MRLTRYFLPVLRETPKEAEIVSHQLMLRAGLVKQASAGIYSWPWLYRLGRDQEALWLGYLDALATNGLSRDH